MQANLPRPHPVISRWSIRWAVPVLLAVPTVAACLLLVVLATYRFRTAVDELALGNFADTHQRIIAHIEGFLAQPPRINTLNAHLLDAGKLDVADLPGWRPILFQQLHTFNELSCISWDGADGRHAWITRYPGRDEIYFAVNNTAETRQVVERRCDGGGELSADPARTYEIDPRQFAPFKAGAHADGLVWTDPFDWVSEDGSILTRALANVTAYRDAQGKLLGVLTAQLTLHDVSLFLTHETPSPNGRIFVLDNQGHLLADSRLSPLLDEQHRPVRAADSTEPDFAAAASFVTAEHLDQEPGRRLMQIADQSWLLVATPFHHKSGLDWTIVTFAPERDFLFGLERARRDGLLMAAAVTAFTVVLGLVLASVVVRPMIVLKDYLRRLGQGDLDARIALPYSREFVEMSDDINRMTQDLKAHLRLRQDVAVAEQVQKSLLPATMPTWPGLEVAAFNRFCEKTGGDYYDFVQIDRDGSRELVVAVGDVMGHGLPAALLMATARGILRSRCDSSSDLADILHHANRHVMDRGRADRERFMTLLLLALEARTGRMRFASAGHGCPLVYDAAGDRFLPIDGGGVPLGVLGDPDYQEHAITRPTPGSIILLGTDGLWETRNPAGKIIGWPPLHQVIRGHADRTAAEVLSALEQAVDRHRGQRPLEDDLTVVVIKIA
ncbi:MAG: SpoIIE family protein phosphatase [Phycisphaeraceae bacterium]|nr:SpoIIE family protein phosphatase [Phycisphaeraceae bacterium]